MQITTNKDKQHNNTRSDKIEKEKQPRKKETNTQLHSLRSDRAPNNTGKAIWQASYSTMQNTLHEYSQAQEHIHNHTNASKNKYKI